MVKACFSRSFSHSAQGYVCTGLAHAPYFGVCWRTGLKLSGTSLKLPITSCTMHRFFVPKTFAPGSLFIMHTICFLQEPDFERAKRQFCQRNGCHIFVPCFMQSTTHIHCSSPATPINCIPSIDVNTHAYQHTDAISGTHIRTKNDFSICPPNKQIRRTFSELKLRKNLEKIVQLSILYCQLYMYIMSTEVSKPIPAPPTSRQNTSSFRNSKIP